MPATQSLQDARTADEVAADLAAFENMKARNAAIHAAQMESLARIAAGAGVEMQLGPMSAEEEAFCFGEQEKPTRRRSITGRYGRG